MSVMAAVRVSQVGAEAFWMYVSAIESVYQGLGRGFVQHYRLMT